MTNVRRVLAALIVAVGATSAVASHAALQWQPTSLPSGFRYQLAAGPSGQIVAVGGGVMYRSLDDGATWAPMATTAPPGFSVHLAYDSQGALYLSDFALGVFRSDDDGAHWSTGLVEEGCNGLAVSGADVVFAGLTYTGNGKVHRSANGGALWSEIALPEASGSFATECFAFGDSGEVYAGTIDGFYRSADHGLTWQRSNTGLSGINVRTLITAPDQTLYMQTNFPSLIDGVYRSRDRGRTWERRGGTGPYFEAMLALPNGDLLGVKDAVVQRSTDAGASWQNDHAGIPASERPQSLLMSPTGRLFVGGRYVYRTTSSLLDAEPPARATALALRAPSPNPSRESVVIRFVLPAAGDAAVELFDLGGRRVAWERAPHGPAGERAVRFDTRMLPAGTYVCRLSAGGASTARRLVVLH